MSNTKIQIKRSSVTTAPTTLSAGEQAYSYLSDKLFIGNAAGDGTIAIGGKYFIDQLNVAFGVTNSAYDYANTLSNNLGNTSVSSNNYAGFMANAANAYAAATYLPYTGGTLTGDLTVQANLTVTGTTTYVNTQSLLVSDNIFVLNADLDPGISATQDAGMEVNRGADANVSLLWNEGTNKWTFTNDGTTYVNIVGNTELESVATSANGYAVQVGAAGNTYAESVGAAGNTYAEAVGAAGNTYAESVGTSGNAYAVVVGSSANNYAGFMANAANAYAASVGAAGNTYADGVGTAANTNAANGSYISTGIVKVPVGGTGKTSFTENGILFGNNSGDLKVTASGIEGNVLQVNGSGVPQFGMLDGGSF